MHLEQLTLSQESMIEETVISSDPCLWFDAGANIAQRDPGQTEQIDPYHSLCVSVNSF